MLDGLLPAGLGLGAFRLALLFAPLSAKELIRFAAVGATTLLGRLVFLTAMLGCGGGTTVDGCSTTLIAAGLTNMPLSCSQSK